VLLQKIIAGVGKQLVDLVIGQNLPELAQSCGIGNLMFIKVHLIKCKQRLIEFENIVLSIFDNVP
jgi:hypothetical protein